MVFSGPAALLVRVAGVNFDACIDDTQDLSTIRGGSLTLLNAGKLVHQWLAEQFGASAVEVISLGASLALFRVEGVSDADALERDLDSMLRRHVQFPINEPLYPKDELRSDPPPVHAASFVIASASVVPGDRASEHKALLSVETECAHRQYQQATLVPWPAPDQDVVNALGGKGPAAAICPIEHRLPVGSLISVREDMEKEAITVASFAHDEKRIAVAASVADRRPYGRSARQRLYGEQLGALATDLDLDKTAFADAFEDLVIAPPATLPHQLQNKMAVLYADGIGFGQRLKDLQASNGPLAGLKVFSEQVTATQVKGLLRPLLRRMAIAARHPDEAMCEIVSTPFEKADNPKARRDGWAPIFRFETLTWAGDDICWVMPGWLAWEIAGGLFEDSAKCAVAGSPPQYRVGVVICPRRMPIRKARGLAGDLAGFVTDVPQGQERVAGCQLETIESIDLSDDHLERHRERILSEVPHTAYTIAARDWRSVEEHVVGLREGPRAFPRSQLYRLLRMAVVEGALGPERHADKENAVLDELKRTLDRHGYEHGVKGHPLNVADFQHTLLGHQDGGHALTGLVRLAQLWDVVLPFGNPVLEEPLAQEKAAA